MDSSVLAARVLKSMSSASNYSLSQPIPTPSITLPLDSISRVAISLANISGFLWGKITMPVASLSFVVTEAKYASHIIGSGITALSPPGILPEGVYG